MLHDLTEMAGRGARYRLPWNHPDRWPVGSPDRVRPFLLRICRLHRVQLRRLPAGPHREIVGLQLRTVQMSLARIRVSRAMLTYGTLSIEAGTRELMRLSHARAEAESRWRTIQAQIDESMSDTAKRLLGIPVKPQGQRRARR